MGRVAIPRFRKFLFQQPLPENDILLETKKVMWVEVLGWGAQGS